MQSKFDLRIARDKIELLFKGIDDKSVKLKLAIKTYPLSEQEGADSDTDLLV